MAFTGTSFVAAEAAPAVATMAAPATASQMILAIGISLPFLVDLDGVSLTQYA
jgi:hypothetical protein